MSKYIDLTGQTFGRWVVLSSGKKEKCKETYFFCRCSCGTERLVVASSLKSKKSTSCGCYHHEVVALPSGESCCRHVYYSYKRHAEERALIFDISLDEFKIITQLPCHYCGAVGTPFAEKREMKGSYVGNGIDRKDNLIGYVVSNCLPCCEWCNGMKSSKTYDEFISHISNIYRHLGEK